MNPFLLLACSDYQLGAGDFVEEPPSRSETQDPSSDFPLVDACADLGLYLPGLDSNGGENFHGICPLDGTTDTYTSDDNGRVAACTTVPDARSENLASQAKALFWDDIDVAALLNCEISMTVFTELTRTESGHDDDAVLIEDTRSWITFGYHKDDAELATFESEGLVDEDGDATESFPLDAIFISGFHERPLSEFEYQTIDRDHARDVQMNVAVLPKHETVSSDNRFGFHFFHDGTSWTELNLLDNADSDDGEKLAYTSEEAADYSLSTVRATIPDFVDPLAESLAGFCGIKTDFRGTKYCAKYFSNDKE